jgi:hypothetical protein
MRLVSEEFTPRLRVCFRDLFVPRRSMDRQLVQKDEAILDDRTFLHDVRPHGTSWALYSITRKRFNAAPTCAAATIPIGLATRV